MKNKQTKIKPNKVVQTGRKIKKIKTEIKDFGASVKALNIIDPADYKYTWRTKFNLNVWLKWYKFKKNILSYYIPFSIKENWYKFKCFFNPKNKKYRAAIPNTWADVCVLIEDVNFAFVKGFYEDEYKSSIVDWQASGDNVSKFAKWIERAYKYITVERPQLQKDLDAAYPALTVKRLTEINRGNYETEYAEVHRFEKLILDKDTKILTEIIKYRHYFWT
jgi:hypothetical protein